MEKKRLFQHSSLGILQWCALCYHWHVVQLASIHVSKYRC